MKYLILYWLDEDQVYGDEKTVPGWNLYDYTDKSKHAQTSFDQACEVEVSKDVRLVEVKVLKRGGYTEENE